MQTLPSSPTNTSKYHAWQQSLYAAPVLIDYQLSPLSAFIRDDATRQTYEAALEKFVNIMGQTRTVKKL